MITLSIPMKKKGKRNQWGENNSSWKGGISKTDSYLHQQRAKRCFGSLENYQNAMQKYDGWCAFTCDKKATLVHHLDGRSVKNRQKVFLKINNTLQNLIPLCRSCHRKLHMWGIKRDRDSNGRFYSKINGGL